MEPLEERVRPFALRLPEPLFFAIQQLAKDEKRSINAQIIYMLEQARGMREPEPRKPRAPRP